MNKSSLFGRKILLTMMLLATMFLVWSALESYKAQLHYVEVEVTRVVYETVPVTVTVPVVSQERIYYVVRDEIVSETVSDVGNMDLGLNPTPESTPVGISADATVVYVETVDGSGNPVNQAHGIYEQPIGMHCGPDAFNGEIYISSQIVAWLDSSESVEIVALPPEGFSQSMVGVKSLENPNRVGWVYSNEIELDTLVQENLPRTSDLLAGCWRVPTELVVLQTPDKYFALSFPNVQTQLRCRPDETSGIRFNFGFNSPVLIERTYGDWFFVRVWSPGLYDAPGWVKKAHLGTVFPVTVPEIEDQDIEDFYKC